jgi:hypothetical protein
MVTGRTEPKLKRDAYLTDEKRLFRVKGKVASGVFSAEDCSMPYELVLRLGEQDILKNMRLVTPDPDVTWRSWREEHPVEQTEQPARGTRRSAA